MFSMTDMFAAVDVSQNLVAYLDPGSGSMMLQILIAGAFSGIFFFKSSLGYLKAKLFGFRVSR